MNKLKPFTPFFTFAILLLVTYYLCPLNARVIDSFNQQHGNQQHGNQQYISQQQANQQAEHKVAAQLTEIDRINYLPSLLPMIINNADIIELEPDQLDALIASPTGIFGIHALREVTEYSRFWAIGSGAEYALGAMYAVYDSAASAQDIAEKGVEAGAEFNNASSMPLSSYVLDSQQLKSVAGK